MTPIRDMNKKIKDLKKEIRTLKKEKEKKQEQIRTRWRPEYREVYWYVNCFGTVWWDRFSVCPFTYGQDNCFKTEKEAIERKEILETKGELRELAEELNNGVAIDWDNKEQKKYFIAKRIEGELEQFYNTKIIDMGQIYCLDKHFLEAAKKYIGTERLIKMIKSGV